MSCFGAGVERSASGLIGRRVASIVPSSRRLDSLDAAQLLGARHQADGPHKAVRYVHDERRDGLVIGGDDDADLAVDLRQVDAHLARRVRPDGLQEPGRLLLDRDGAQEPGHVFCPKDGAAVATTTHSRMLTRGFAHRFTVAPLAAQILLRTTTLAQVPSPWLSPSSSRSPGSLSYAFVLGDGSETIVTVYLPAATR